MTVESYFTELYRITRLHQTNNFNYEYDCSNGMPNTQTPGNKKCPKPYGPWDMFNMHCTELVLYTYSVHSMTGKGKEPRNGKRDRRDTDSDVEENEIPMEGIKITRTPSPYLLILFCPGFLSFSYPYSESNTTVHILEFPEEVALLEDESGSVVGEESGRKKRRTLTKEEIEEMEREGKNFIENYPCLECLVCSDITWRNARGISCMKVVWSSAGRSRAIGIDITIARLLIARRSRGKNSNYEHVSSSVPYYTNHPADSSVRKEGGEEEKKKKKPKRSAEALKRRAEKAKLKKKQNKITKRLGNTHLAEPPRPPTSGKGGKAGGSKPKPDRPSRPSYTLQVSLNSVEGEPTEDHRRALMADLALRISERPSSSSATPISLRDSRVAAGRILLVAEDEGSREAIVALLEARSDLTVRSGPIRRRFAFGGPGYLMSLPDQAILRFLLAQNPEMPAGSMSLVSVNRGGQGVTAYVDVTEEGYSYLASRRFQLRTMTTPVTLRPANGSSRRSS